MLRSEYGIATRSNSNHRGESLPGTVTETGPSVISRDVRRCHLDAEVIREGHSGSLERLAVKTGSAEARRVVTNAAERWETSGARAANDAGASSAHRGLTAGG